LDSFVQIEKSEWEAFLNELSEFEKRYELLLTRLDWAENTLRALSEPEKANRTSEAVGQTPSEDSRKGTVLGSANSFLSGLNAKLQPRGTTSNLSLPHNQVSCGRCGFKIRRASRFCTCCGADFGKWVCSCGRELLPGDKFCDRCGRPCGDGAG